MGQHGGVSLVEVAGAAEVGVLQNGGGLGVAGAFGGQVVGQDGGDALVGQRADLEGAGRDRFGARAGSRSRR